MVFEDGWSSLILDWLYVFYDPLSLIVFSSSSVSYMTGEESVHTRAVVGGEHITILDGVLANPTAKAQVKQDL